MDIADSTLKGLSLEIVEVIIKEESKSLRSDQLSGRIASERHLFLPALRGSQFRCEDT